MKGYVKTLKVRGHLLTDLELINHILDGLGLEFNVMVASLITKIESSFEILNLQDAMYILQKHKLRLGKINAYMSSNVALNFHSTTVNTTSVVKPNIHLTSDHANRHHEK